MIEFSRLWATDWVVCGFFAYLVVLSRIQPLGGRNRLRVLATGLVCGGLAIMLSQLEPSPTLRILREWLPGIYLVQGYWLCGIYFVRPMLGIEQRLLETDRWFMDVTNLSGLLTHGPRLVLEYFELAYLMVYPMVPVSFGVLLLVGGRASADSFWTATLVSGFGCYGVLPWVQTRPPRNLERDTRPALEHLVIRRLNLHMLRHSSVHVNTFPSGHASVAIAAALSVATVNAAAGAALLVLAISIVIATVLGRYHYSIDSLLGVMVGLLGWWIGFRSLGGL